MAKSKCANCNGTGFINIIPNPKTRPICYYCGSPKIMYLSDDNLWMCLNSTCSHYLVSVQHCSRYSKLGGA